MTTAYPLGRVAGSENSSSSGSLVRRQSHKGVRSLRVLNTMAQNAHRDTFKLAAIYAQPCLLQPAVCAEYETIASAMEIQCAFVAAPGDYLDAVQIKAIVTETYAGEAGYPIGILKSELHKVKTMKVMNIDPSVSVMFLRESFQQKKRRNHKTCNRCQSLLRCA